MCIVDTRFPIHMKDTKFKYVGCSLGFVSCARLIYHGQKRSSFAEGWCIRAYARTISNWGTLHILIKSAALPESQEFRTVSSSSGMIMSSSRVLGLLQFGMLLRHLSLKIGQDHLRKRSLQILVMFFLKKRGAWALLPVWCSCHWMCVLLYDLRPLSSTPWQELLERKELEDFFFLPPPFSVYNGSGSSASAVFGMPVW